MIQLSALPTVPGTANMAEFLGNGGAETGGPDGFEALLAVQLGTAPVWSDPAITATRLGPLPDSGKLLPPADPKVPIPLRASPFAAGAEDTAAPEDHAVEPIEQLVAQALVPASPSLLGPAQPAPTPLAPIPANHSTRAAAAPPVAQSAAQPVNRALAKPKAAPRVTLPLIPAALPLVQPLAEPEVLVEAASQLVSVNPKPGQSQSRTLPALTVTPMLTPLVASELLPILPAAHAAILRVRTAPASSASGLPSALASKLATALIPVFKPLRDKTALLPEVSFAPPALPSAAAEAKLASTAPALPAIRPLDLAALVDRLVEARDAAAPQTVSLALTHTEFGKVSLRFQQDEAGLSVAMASPDPDFAKAVSAAIPLERAASGEPPPGTSNGPASRYEAGSSETPGQSRGGANPERRDDRSAPRSNPAQTQRHPTEKPSRNGIFA